MLARPLNVHHWAPKTSMTPQRSGDAMTSSRARSAMTWGGNGVTTAVGIAIVAMCVLTVLPAAQPAPSAPRRAALAAQDYIDIQQLVRKYAWALDGGDNYGY